MKKRKTFISYSHQDSSLIEHVIGLLRTQGGVIFYDRDSIHPGERWHEAIQDAIRKSDQIIVFSCCHSINSKWVRSEIEKGVELRKPIIPILFCRVNLPTYLKEFQWIDFSQMILHNCIDHNSETSYKYLSNRDISLMYGQIDKHKKLYWLLSLGVLIIMFVFLMVKPFPPFFGLPWARLTNLVVLMCALLYSILIILRLRRMKRAFANPMEELIWQAVAITEKKPFGFYPREHE